MCVCVCVFSDSGMAQLHKQVEVLQRNEDSANKRLTAATQEVSNGGNEQEGSQTERHKERKIKQMRRRAPACTGTTCTAHNAELPDTQLHSSAKPVE